MAATLFRDAVAVVTGGASGLGRALCEELGRRGARVVVTDIQETEARAVAEGIVAAGEARNLSLDHWRKVLDVNLWGVIHGATAAYARMARQGSGHIVNIASLAGLVSMALGAPYTASKFGVVGLSAG
jgi:NAD(P)-dependent dehydrogenase (short-subunit alcohol dehydrogenase family)